jgi:Tol biopolymer transport system component
MKGQVKFAGVLLSIIFVLMGRAQQEDFPVLKGPYLGQKPAGMTPEIFAPQIITEAPHSVAVFSPDGREVFWVPWSTLRMKTMEQINGIWTKPDVVSFASEYDAENPWLTADGARMYFTSTRPLESEELNGKAKFWRENIWYVNREQDGWSEPIPLGSEVNSKDLHWQFSIDDRNGDLYFSASSRKDGGGSDIYRSAFSNGRYAEPMVLGEAINTRGDEDTPCIASDGSYLIFARKPGPDTLADLHISFRSHDGSWQKAVCLNQPINSEAHEVCPVVTRDGKYLFFISMRSGKPEIYWVDASIIEEFRSHKER